MKRLLYLITIGIALIGFAVATASADEFLESLQQDQVVHGFKTVSLYDNAAGQAMGGRFVSEKFGFIVDLVQIQSVPQAFYWIKTPITSSRGEPHACEHLLLGKGNRGRYVAALEDMALGTSTAYTQQYRTCYHFNTVAGEETFYDIFEAKLQALLHPDFTDEEIRREVCHVGVIEDPQTGLLSIDEKGTVFTEMVSSFERPWYHTYGTLFKLVYGEDHPFTNVSGGDPDVMRSMVPEDMWNFHAATHHLANMGTVASIPAAMPADAFLKKMSEMLDRCQEAPDSSPLSGIGAFNFPPPNPAEPGTKKIVPYPTDDAEDPGALLYSWPADLELDYRERSVLELFLETFASGETSDLYDLFINSETRQIDLGANAVDGWIEDNFGLPICVDITGVTNSLVSEAMLDSVKVMIVEAVRQVRDMADGSDELKEFNQRMANRLIEIKKHGLNRLNQPPMFGFRSGPAGQWLNLMEEMEPVSGFRKSLVMKDRMAYTDSLLNLDENVWRSRIDQWRLLTVEPFAVGAVPGTDIVAANLAAKEKRLAGYIKGFKQKYGTDDEQAAIAAYRTEFDAKTAELEAAAAGDLIPDFIDSPPMTLDDQLIYETITLPGEVPMVASTFDNMSSSRFGLALRLDVIPESLMVYVPFLPSVLTDIGVYENGEVVNFSDMQERLRREVLSLGANFTYGLEKGRVELLVSGEGANADELAIALGWMDAALFSPYLALDNLPRIQDRLDQLIQANRNRTRGPEEYWVDSPSLGYRHQDNPLIMSTYCFLTQTFHLQRLRWFLTDPGDATGQAELTTFMAALKTAGRDKTHEELVATLNSVEDETAAEATLRNQFADLSESSQGVLSGVVLALKATLGEIPAANLANDWVFLCDRTRDDLLVSPAQAISRLKEVLALVSHTDNARTFMISNTGDRDKSLGPISKLTGKLDDRASARQAYQPTLRVVKRLASREAGVNDPVYVGLIYEGTQNGVLMFNADIADDYDTTTASMLTCLSGKLYGGGGPHGFFMRTWAAGLAYSNGYGYRQGSGRVSYYAERCPDVAETMRFVVSVLKDAQENPGLAEYAVAQIFGSSRAPSRYEQRGVAMAADLADGITPEKVRAFRQKVLDLRKREGLYEDISQRMEEAYGPVLIGFGEPLAKSRDGNFFLIGPEQQFKSLENYIETTEGKQTVYRLYPRDFWLTI